MRLEGHIALVTGASRGIGHAIAQELGNAGARVIGTATSSDGAARISAELATQSVEGVVLDVNNGEQIEQVIKDIESRHGAVSILVNNAGITRDNLLLRMKDEEWDQVIDTDLRSIYRLTKSGAAADAEGPLRAHHQCELGDRRDRECRTSQLRGRKGGSGRLH